MKKILLFTIILLSIQLANAQPKFSLSGGVKLIKPDNRDMTLWYVDESPSMDNCYRSVKQDGNLAINFSARYQDNDLNRKYHFFVEGQGYIGSINGLALNIGAVYISNYDSKVRIQPEIAGVIGYCTKGLGEIENNDIYIQVNDTKFQDYTNVNVALRNIYFGIKPGLSFIAKAGSDNEIGVGASFQLSGKIGMLAFSGADQEGNNVTETENLNADNVYFMVDGDKTDVIPYNPDGIELKVFFNF